MQEKTEEGVVLAHRCTHTYAFPGLRSYMKGRSFICSLALGGAHVFVSECVRGEPTAAHLQYGTITAELNGCRPAQVKCYLGGGGCVSKNNKQKQQQQQHKYSQKQCQRAAALKEKHVRSTTSGTSGDLGTQETGSAAPPPPGTAGSVKLLRRGRGFLWRDDRIARSD